MKPTIFKFSLILFLGNLFFLSCKKHDDLVKPVPQTPPPVLSRYFRLAFDSLPGTLPAEAGNLFALVTVVNHNNDTLLSNRKLAITYDGKFKTAELELPAGNYRVTQLLIVNSNNLVLFATPLVNSAKAPLVSRPLPVSFILPQPVAVNVALGVAAVAPTDTPESFGYPVGLFNGTPGNDGGQTAFKIKLKLAIKVGDILYDSLTGTVLYFNWDENQQVSGKYIPLTGGINEIELPRSASRHQLRIKKWGTDYELNLLKNEVKQDSVYILGGTKQPKKLQSEITAKLAGGIYVAESKTSYTYTPAGKLAAIDYYLKKDNKPYLAMKDQFQYSNGQLEKVSRYDEKNNSTGFTSFSYNAAGKINGIIEQSGTNRTTATVDYFYSPETGFTEVGFNYSYSHHSNAMRYYQRYHKGNVFSDNSNSENHSSETGLYDYDNQINPYAHMGWHNLFLSNNSKNNLVRQYKTYYGNYPEAVAYEFNYKYDADGYPVELIRHFRSAVTNKFLYTTKTVFNY